jgi:hypothetical protein
MRVAQPHKLEGVVVVYVKKWLVSYCNASEPQ